MTCPFFEKSAKKGKINEDSFYNFIAVSLSFQPPRTKIDYFSFHGRKSLTSYPAAWSRPYRGLLQIERRLRMEGKVLLILQLGWRGGKGIKGRILYLFEGGVQEKERGKKYSCISSRRVRNRGKKEGHVLVSSGKRMVRGRKQGKVLVFLHREREREGLFLGFLKEDEEKRKEERKEKFLHHFKDEAPSRNFV